MNELNENILQIWKVGKLQDFVQNIKGVVINFGSKLKFLQNQDMNSWDWGSELGSLFFFASNY